MTANVPFTVAACSGEDPEFTSQELLLHSQDSKGWCTARNCTYPQSLTLTLETPASLQQIQLLSHEYKIAAKVEIQIATSSQINQTDPTATAFTRLGYLSFDNNERTQHSARELKSVSLTVPEAKLVRFIFHRCFKNRLNVYNQVAIIMINIVGQPLVQHQVLQGPPVTLATGPLSPPPHHHYGAPSGNNNINASHSAGVSPVKPQFPNSNNSSLVVLTNEQQVALLQAELKVDIVTAQHILDMTVQKQEAVAKEEYDEAKRLKHAIDKLKVVGERIALLEAKKVAAVDAEDYDLAKTVKHEVDKLRNRSYAAIIHSAAAAAQGTNDIEFGFSSPSPSRRPTSAEVASSTGGGRLLAGRQLDINASIIESATPATGAAAGNTKNTPTTILNTNTKEGGGNLLSPPFSTGTSSEWAAYDERPAKARGVYDLSNIEVDEEALALAAASNAGNSTKTRRRSSVSPGHLPAMRGTMNNKRSEEGGASSMDLTGGIVVDTKRATIGSADLPVAEGDIPNGFPLDLPRAEALSAEDAKDAGPMADVVGSYLAACLYSKAWQLREAALLKICDDIHTGNVREESIDGNAEALRTVTRTVVRALKDKVPAVGSAAVSVFKEMAIRQVGKCSTRDVHAVVSDVLPLLVERAADLNTRTREHAVDALKAMSEVKGVGLGHMTPILLKPFKPTDNKKSIVSRVQLITTLLPLVGISPPPPNTTTTDIHNNATGGGNNNAVFHSEAVATFAGTALKHSNVDVRAAGTDLVKLLSSLVSCPKAVLAMLPSDLNPKTRQAVEGVLGVQGSDGENSGSRSGNPAASRPETATKSTTTNTNSRKSIASASGAAAGRRSSIAGAGNTTGNTRPSSSGRIAAPNTSTNNASDGQQPTNRRRSSAATTTNVPAAASTTTAGATATTTNKRTSAQGNTTTTRKSAAGNTSVAATRKSSSAAGAPPPAAGNQSLRTSIQEYSPAVTNTVINPPPPQQQYAAAPALLPTHITGYPQYRPELYQEEQGNSSQQHWETRLNNNGIPVAVPHTAYYNQTQQQQQFYRPSSTESYSTTISEPHSTTTTAVAFSKSLQTSPVAGGAPSFAAAGVLSPPTVATVAIPPPAAGAVGFTNNANTSHGMVSTTEDPRPYEALLRNLEASLGPSHPDVAEAASNLAIIYNQGGDPVRALPLYQRALSIWEKTLGPYHSDVAHVLTDIAVIHLEAGRESDGRPLLQRALNIQERLLGPEHPDVVAIRDVLEDGA